MCNASWAPDCSPARCSSSHRARVLVLTGRWWFEPFAERAKLNVEWRDGLVSGVVRQPARTWVIAGHPQGKPRGMLDEVVEAFAGR